MWRDCSVEALLWSTSAAPSDGGRFCIGDLCMYHHEQTLGLDWAASGWVLGSGFRSFGLILMGFEDWIEG